jgi:hypothetical protein
MQGNTTGLVALKFTEAIVLFPVPVPFLFEKHASQDIRM